MRELYPQPQQSVSLCDALDRVLDTGVVAVGEAMLSVADVDLLYLGFQLVVTSVEGGRESGAIRNDWPTSERIVRDDPPPRLPPPPATLARPIEPAPFSAPTPPAKRACPAATPVAGHSEVKNGFSQLVLTLVKVLHELLKRQALRRVEGGSLDLSQMERLGVTLMRQAQEIERIAAELGLEEEDLNLDLGPLGKLL
jgi:Gas vesicle protein K/Gas vesicle protein